MLFFKLSGGGNDFIALAEPEETPAAERIRKLCSRGLSVGADGLFTVRRTPEGVRMDYWNADGRPAEFCLNGTRCAVRLALHLGWTSDALTVFTGAGPVAASAAGEHEIVLRVHPPKTRPRALTVAIGGENFDGSRVTVGVPHFVLSWPQPLDGAPVETLGKRLRHAEEFAPAGANVHFVCFPNAHELQIRTYERGVEAETLACGSGVLSATAAGIHSGDLDFPVRAHTRGGFVFTIDGEAQNGTISSWSLQGDARLVAEGYWHPGAEIPPPASSRA